MSSIKSIGLSDEYKEKRKKRIIFMREKADPPVVWSVIANRLHIGRDTAERIYEEAKCEQEKSKKI